MPTPDDPRVFKTPDPLITGEALAAYITSILSALIVLFKLDLSDAQRGAALTVILGVLALGTFLYGAIVRRGRAMGNAQK